MDLVSSQSSFVTWVFGQYKSGTISNIGSFDFMRVKIGAHDIDVAQEEIEVVEIIGNPNYIGLTFDNDISLLRLATSVDTNKFTPLRLEWNPAKYVEGTPARVIGWGTTESGSLSTTLMEAEVPLVSQETCTAPGSYPVRLREANFVHQICDTIRRNGKH